MIIDSIEIRPIQSSDDAVLAKIIRDVFLEFDAPKTGTVYSDPSTDNLTNYFASAGAKGFVALYKGEVMGCGGIYPTETLPLGHVEFVKMYIKPEGRGKGLGYRLLKKSEEAAYKLGYKTLYLESLPAFKKALALYEQNDFTYVDKSIGNSCHSSCNIFMVKSIR